MDTSRYIDRILETENLTDNLEDDDANVLIDWGVGHLNTVIGESGDEEVAGSQVMALMNVMRSINRIIGNFPIPHPDGLKEFIHSYDNAFATDHSNDFIEHEVIATQLAGMTPSEALLFLLTWFNPTE